MQKKNQSQNIMGRQGNIDINNNIIINININVDINININININQNIMSKQVKAKLSKLC